MPSGYSVAADGAVMTQEEVRTLLVEPLLAQAVVLRANPQLFASRGVPLRIPKITALDLSDPWRAENTQIAEEDPDFGELTLLPSSLKSLKVIHRVSNELVRHSILSVGDALAAALVRRVANAVDKAFLVGDGAANTIRGIVNITGAQTVAGVGQPSVDDLHDAEGKLLAANADPARAAWFLNPRDLVSLRKAKDSSGAYLVQPDPTESGGYKLLGHRVFVTTQIPTNGGAGTNESRIILADMSQVAVAQDQDIKVTFLTETYGGWDQVGIRVTARFDIGLLNAEGAVVLNGVTP